MAEIDITIPSMLATLVKGERRFRVEAGDLRAVMDAMLARYPQLRVHVLDESGALRPHVMMFHNDRAIRAIEGPVHDGDTVTILQAVSGGASPS